MKTNVMIASQINHFEESTTCFGSWSCCKTYGVHFCAGLNSFKSSNRHILHQAMVDGSKQKEITTGN